MVRSLNIVVAAVAVVLVGSVHFAAFGQTPTAHGPPAVSTTTTPDASKVETFRSRLQDQQKTLESYEAKISGLVDRLKAMSGATVEIRIAEVRSLTSRACRFNEHKSIVRNANGISSLRGPPV